MNALRVECFLISFLQNFYQDDLESLCIICPPRDLSKVAAILAKLTDDRRYTVISEATVIAKHFFGDPSDLLANPDGWKLQQILKLAYAFETLSSFYVTLDCDILCTRRCSYADFVLEDRANIGVETKQNYEKLYTESFVATELKRKRERYDCSAKLLRVAHSRTPRDSFYSETPVVLNTQNVRELLGYLMAIHTLPWMQTLFDHVGWTEYGLYFQYCEMRGLIEDGCNLGGSCAVLDLDRSVWHRNSAYRVRRTYSIDSLLSCHSTMTGPFIAIQSWLPSQSWLPVEHSNLLAFYSEVRLFLMAKD